MHFFFQIEASFFARERCVRRFRNCEENSLNALRISASRGMTRQSFRRWPAWRRKTTPLPRSCHITSYYQLGHLDRPVCRSFQDTIKSEFLIFQLKLSLLTLSSDIGHSQHSSSNSLNFTSKIVFF